MHSVRKRKWKIKGKWKGKWKRKEESKGKWKRKGYWSLMVMSVIGYGHGCNWLWSLGIIGYGH